jgi:NhaP-type Na+/H+ or K+/H+ antiporter
MSATTSGAGCGVVLGIVLVLLAQQFGFLSLSGLDDAIERLVIGAVVGGVLGALIGWALGRRYLSKHPPAEMVSAPDAGTAPP